jgi:hypothetical protein
MHRRRPAVPGGGWGASFSGQCKQRSESDEHKSVDAPICITTAKIASVVKRQKAPADDVLNFSAYIFLECCLSKFGAITLAPI